MLFGRSPRLPIDLLFGTVPGPTKVNHTEFVDRWKGAMREAYAKAMKSSCKSAAIGKKHYDRKVQFTRLKPGDRVLVRNLSERGGPGKVRSYWENQIHEVVERKGEQKMSVFVVKPEGHDTGRDRVLHRNLLLPCDFLPPDIPENVRPAAQQRRMKRKRVMQDDA